MFSKEKVSTLNMMYYEESMYACVGKQCRYINFSGLEKDACTVFWLLTVVEIRVRNWLAIF